MQHELTCYHWIPSSGFKFWFCYAAVVGEERRSHTAFVPIIFWNACVSKCSLRLMSGWRRIFKPKRRISKIHLDFPYIKLVFIFWWSFFGFRCPDPPMGQGRGRGEVGRARDGGSRGTAPWTHGVDGRCKGQGLPSLHSWSHGKSWLNSWRRYRNHISKLKF